ncbi:MAG: proliferating cell nuclear antigen (pcna) [Promethearchaeota archaeon]
MFKAKINDSRIVKGIFEAVSAIISETLLKVNKEGITLTAMDLSHICLVSLTLKKEDMDEFETDQDYELGINLEDLVKIIKRSGAQDAITLSHDPKDKKLVIEMVPESGKKARKFTMSLIEIEGEEINMESLEGMEFENKCVLDLKFIDEAIKDAEIFSEVLQVQVKDGERLNFSTTGNIGDMNSDLEKDQLISADFTGDSNGIFAISFLKNILKVSAISNQAEIALKSESPLKLAFKILNASKILYFLAPRVEEEDDSMYED